MKPTRARLAVLAFVAFVAVLVLYPQRDDPAVVATAGCAAIALALREHMTGAEAAPGADPALAEVEAHWTRLDRDLTSARRTAHAGYLQFNPKLEEERRARDARVAAGEGAAWAEQALARLRACDPLPGDTT